MILQMRGERVNIFAYTGDAFVGDAEMECGEKGRGGDKLTAPTSLEAASVAAAAAAAEPLDDAIEQRAGGRGPERHAP